MWTNFAEVLESYMIPAVEGTKYPIGDLKWAKPLLNKKLDEEKFYKKLYSIDDDMADINSILWDEAKDFSKNINPLPKPTTDCISVMKSEITKAVNEYTSSSKFTKYYSIYKPLINLEFKLWSINKDIAALTVSFPIMNNGQYWKYYNQWNENNAKNFADLESNRRESLMRKINPYSNDSWCHNICLMIEEFTNKRFKDWFDNFYVSSQTSVTIQFKMQMPGRMSDEDITNIRKSIINDFTTKMKESGYSSGKKTYQITGVDEPAITFVAYDEIYSEGNLSDYRNGLTKEDKTKNEKFVTYLYKVLNDLKKKYPKVKFNYDIYRGHGTIDIIIE